MATEFVNKHITRVLTAGGTVAEPAWLDTVDSWISSQSLLPYLFDWANPAFGVIKDGSNHISKIIGLGTTWLSRVGDLTPSAPTNTLYDATAISSKPGWTNSVSSAYSYYGLARGGTIRADLVRRKHRQGFTVVCVYKKNHSNTSSMLGWGQFNMMFLQNTSGAPGSCKFCVGPPGAGGLTDTHATTLTNNAVHIIGGTFDGDKVTSYIEGVAGSGASGYVTAFTDANKRQYRPLLGSGAPNNATYFQIVSGSSEVINTNSTTSVARTLSATKNEADMSISDLIVFDTCLTPTQMASLNSTLRTRYP